MMHIDVDRAPRIEPLEMRVSDRRDRDLLVSPRWVESGRSSGFLSGWFPATGGRMPVVSHKI
jgi:hypothetical protein